MQCLALGNQTTGTYLLMSLTLNYKTRYITCIKFKPLKFKWLANWRHFAEVFLTFKEIVE